MDLMTISVEVFTHEDQPLFSLSSVERNPVEICSQATLVEALEGISRFLSTLAEDASEENDS